MPMYEYHCDFCDNHFEAYRSIHLGPEKSCPVCLRSKEFRQVYGNPICHVYDIKTVGQQSEANIKRLGKEQLELRAAEESRKIEEAMQHD